MHALPASSQGRPGRHSSGFLRPGHTLCSGLSHDMGQGARRAQAACSAGAPRPPQHSLACRVLRALHARGSPMIWNSMLRALKLPAAQLRYAGAAAMLQHGARTAGAQNCLRSSLLHSFFLPPTPTPLLPLRRSVLASTWQARTAALCPPRPRFRLGRRQSPTVCAWATCSGGGKNFYRSEQPEWAPP